MCTGGPASACAMTQLVSIWFPAGHSQPERKDGPRDVPGRLVAGLDSEPEGTKTRTENAGCSRDWLACLRSPFLSPSYPPVIVTRELFSLLAWSGSYQWSALPFLVIISNIILSLFRNCLNLFGIRQLNNEARKSTIRRHAQNRSMRPFLLASSYSTYQRGQGGVRRQCDFSTWGLIC